MIKKLKLKNAKIVTIRPAKKEDSKLHRHLIQSLSMESKILRFFNAVSEIKNNMLINYERVESGREIVLIACTKESEEEVMIGVARLLTDLEGGAEIDVVVADEWQNQGLGQNFIDHIQIAAMDRKIKKIYAEVLDENEKMISIFRKKGFSFQISGANYRVEKNI